MEANNCQCEAKSINPSTDFLAKGKVHLFTVLNLKNFIQSNSGKEFERLRGGRAFAHAISTLKPEKYFDEDEYETKTVTRGHEFQVFRGHLKDDWLSRTYLLDKDQTASPFRHFAQERMERI